MTDPSTSAYDRRTDGPGKVPCRGCAHPKDAHEHHRRGTDCSQSGCECRQWKRPHGRLLRAFFH